MPLVLLVLPFLIIVWASLLPFYIQPSFEAIDRFTLKNYFTALHFPKITDSIKNSILLGLGSASAVMVLTLLASWLLVRTKMRGRWLLDILDDAAAAVSRHRHGAGDSCVFIYSCRFPSTARCGFC